MRFPLNGRRVLVNGIKEDVNTCESISWHYPLFVRIKLSGSRVSFSD
jgi:hypothetical protein